MGLFSKKPASILGVDVGASAVKIVELTREAGRAHLRTYGFTERKEEGNADDPRIETEKMGAMIRELRRQSGAQATTVIASLPTFSVFSSIITLPETPKKELPNAIRWEAKKLIPLPLEDMMLNWEILPDSFLTEKAGGQTPKTTDAVTASPVIVSQEKKKSIAVLITAAQKKLVEQYVGIFKAAGLTLQSLETEAFAIVRSLVGGDRSTIMVVDIGARNTDLSIIDGGIPVLNRSMEFGGNTFTDAIEKTTKLSWNHAEQLKRDVSRLATQEMIKALEPLFAPLVNEVHYTLGLYQTRNGSRIEKIILTGGSGLLFNLAQYMTSRFNITVTVGDPWARVATPIDLAPVLSEVGSRMSVAVGLAMRGI
ncbi:MAG: pilus assembly protein PilM [bacterium]|nr:pilus assembly protein PilM [bacterium]